MEELAAQAHEAHRDWSDRLLAATGIDDEYLRCGACYYETAENTNYLDEVFTRWLRRGIEVDPTAPPEQFQAAWRAPAESQVRNPRRLRALQEACRKLGVQIEAHTGLERFLFTGEQIDAAETTKGSYSAGEYVLAAGCWSPSLAEGLNFQLTGRPIRGQMLLLRPRKPWGTEIQHAYPYYLVPRRDGRVLVGATVEDVGYDHGTSESAREELETAAEMIAPGLLKDSVIEGFWSGLRPRGGSELPTIGRTQEHRNLLIATGHYRSGLQLSPPTAELISALIRGERVSPLARTLSPGTRVGACEIG